MALTACYYRTSRAEKRSTRVRAYVRDQSDFPGLAERRLQLAGTMSGGEAMGSVEESFNIVRQSNERGITVFLVEQHVHQTLDNLALRICPLQRAGRRPSLQAATRVRVRTSARDRPTHGPS